MDKDIEKTYQQLLTQYQAEFEGELTSSWYKFCQENKLGLEDNHTNVLYTIFTEGYIEGCRKTQEKFMSIMAGHLNDNTNLGHEE